MVENSPSMADVGPIHHGKGGFAVFPRINRYPQAYKLSTASVGLVPADATHSDVDVDEDIWTSDNCGIARP